MEKVTAFFKKAFVKTKKVFSELKNYHVVKRSNISKKKALLIRVGVGVIALLFCSLLSVVLIGANPVKFITSMFDGAFGTPRRLWKLAKDTAILLCIALAITPAFKMKFWNIGAEGQTLIGALASIATAFYLGGKLPNALLLVIMLFAAIIAGAVWAGVPAICKAKWNTNETLFTLMMNYIATGLVLFFLMVWLPNGQTALGILPHGHLPVIGHEYLLIIISALVIACLTYIYLRYTKHGYEISVVGESENTAKYIGISVGKVVIRTMLISGAICGIAGFLITSALDHSISSETVGGLGFTAIMVSWLAKFNPLVMLGTSLFIVFLDQGANQITTVFNIPSAFPDMVFGIVLFFIIGSEFFINYSIKRREKKEKEVS